MVLCRDCLGHLDLAAARKALDNILHSEARYLLLTTFPDVESNQEIVTGFFRPLNMCLPPFCLPNPVRLLEEDEVGKFLGLWES